MFKQKDGSQRRNSKILESGKPPHGYVCGSPGGSVVDSTLSELQLTFSLPFPTPLKSGESLPGRKGKNLIAPGREINPGCDRVRIKKSSVDCLLREVGSGVCCGVVAGFCLCCRNFLSFKEGYLCACV